jgi:hypothetical protein
MNFLMVSIGIFIPSGVQLLIVLVAILDGAIAIALASFIIGLESYYLDSVVPTFITGLISGGSPLLARKICLDFSGVDRELTKITPQINFADVCGFRFDQCNTPPTLVLLLSGKTRRVSTKHTSDGHREFTRDGFGTEAIKLPSLLKSTRPIYERLIFTLSSYCSNIGWSKKYHQQYRYHCFAVVK